MRGSTIEGFKHITNTLQNTPSYIHWKKTLHPTSLQNTPLHPTSNHMCYFVGFGGFLEPFPATTNHILPAVFYTNQKVLVLGAGFAAAAILLSRIPTEAPLLARGWGCAQHLLARCMHTGLATKFDSNAASAQLPPLLSSGPFPASP